jgi:hypothetical protein
MNANRAVVTAVVVLLVVIAGWWMLRHSGTSGAVDLLAQFDAAETRPSGASFSVVDVTLAGETKKAIAPPPGAGTRIVWKVRVPDDGWLSVSLGLQPETWEKDGDGVLFMVGVSDGKAWDPLFTQHVNPFGNKPDRRWIPVFVDLSTYGGEEVDVVFNTYASPPGKPTDERNDLALWGAPEIIIR